MGVAPASAPGAGVLYAGADSLPREDIFPYGFGAREEAMEQPHQGLGGAAVFGEPAGSATAGAAGSWPSHGLGPGFVSGGRHVLYCGADIPMEQLESGHWHHAQRPLGCGSGVDRGGQHGA